MDAGASPRRDIRVTWRQDSVRQYMLPGIQKQRPHFHALHEMLFVDSGEAVFQIGPREYRLRRGSLLFISNLEYHAISAYAGAYSRYSVCLSNDFLTEQIRVPALLSIFKLRPAGFFHQYDCTPEECEHVEHMFRLIYREYAEQREFWDTLLADKVYDVLVTLYRSHPRLFPGEARKGRSVVFEIQSYIDHHLTEPLALEETARQFFVSACHLSHIFKDVTGYSYKRYIVLARIATAKDMLLYTAQPIRDTCAASGFHDLSHFIRTFRALEGTTPHAYRTAGQKRDK